MKEICLDSIKPVMAGEAICMSNIKRLLCFARHDGKNSIPRSGFYFSKAPMSGAFPL